MACFLMFMILCCAVCQRIMGPPVERPKTDLEFYQQTGIEAGHWHDTKLPDGLKVRAHFKGVLPDRDRLPAQNNEEYDEWYTTNDDHCWIWMTLAGQFSPGWVDP
jgi:hypothetical protein